MPRTRNSWLILIVGLLVVANIFYYLLSGWGLVTIHADNVPLKTVLHDIERQAHITLTTNVDLERPVTMYVTRVPLIEALETLAVVTESRWSLCYLLAPDKTQLQDGLTQIQQPQLGDSWKRVAVPIPPFVDGLSGTADPRNLNWRVEAPSTTNLQDYLMQGAVSADLTFILPKDWNPTISEPPASGKADKVVKKLVSISNGKFDTFFYLSERNRRQFRGERPPGQEGPGGPGGPMQMPAFDYVRLDERIQQQIAQLPPEERTEARATYEQAKTFFADMRKLSPEERRAKMMELMQNPEVQERIESRESRRTPQQRANRASRYVQNRATVRGY